MTIFDLAGVTSLYTDKESGEQLSHEEVYERVINKLGGFNSIISYIPFTYDQVKTAIREDRYLNNLSIRIWDNATADIINVLRNHYITTYSISQCVCILKTAARLWVSC